MIKGWIDNAPDGVAVDKEKLVEGYKADEGKVRMDLIPPEAMFALAHVLTFGAKKYTKTILGEFWKTANVNGLCRKCYERQLRKDNPEFAERQRQNRRDWAERNPDRVRSLARHRTENPVARKRDFLTKRKGRLAKFGLTVEQADELLRGGCEICKSTKHLHLDHDHKTGKFRGILCSKHNNGLGFLGDDIEGLEAALKYLKSKS